MEYVVLTVEDDISPSDLPNTINKWAKQGYQVVTCSHIGQNPYGWETFVVVMGRTANGIS